MILGLGVDILDMRRIQRAWDTLGQAYLDEVFTATEQLYCLKKNAKRIRDKDETTLAGNSFAKMFAIKEATLKAIGLVEGIAWHEIEVRHEQSGRPYVVLSGIAKLNVLTVLTQKLGINEESAYNKINLNVSTSDDVPYAVATVLLEYCENCIK